MTQTFNGIFQVNPSSLRGSRFMLVDYTTRIEPKDKFNEKGGPVLRVERIRCEPKKHRQSSMLAWLRRNKTDSELEYKKSRR